MSDADAEVVPPPEQLSAWQRWELPAFETGRELARNVNLPTAVEVENMQQQVHEEAYQTGYAEGRQQGYAEGMQQALEEKARLAELTQLLESQMDEKVTQDLMGLSLDIAQQVLQQAIKVQPDLLLGMVREAISKLPVFNQAAHIVFNPEDAAMVREHMGEQLTHSGWKIIENTRLARGDARVETANSQVDATLEARWNRVISAMGQESKWFVKS